MGELRSATPELSRAEIARRLALAWDATVRALGLVRVAPPRCGP